jgi:hypothetical protein
MTQQKRDTNNGRNDLPSSIEETTRATSEKSEIVEENRREADLEDKTPAGDSGPEDEA